MIIDQRFIDVDFVNDPNYVLGHNPEADIKRVMAGPFYEDIVPEIPESKWRGIIELLDGKKAGLEYMVKEIKNQKSEGSCVSQACAQGHQMKQAQSFGLDRVTLLSAISLYDFIGRSAGSGASIDDGMTEGSRIGFVPVDNAENKERFKHSDGHSIVMPNTGFKSRRPKGWEQVSLNFRFDECSIIRGYRGLVTAGLMGHPVVVGRRGHSICYTRPIYSGSKLLIPYPNSWDYSWGQPFADMKGGFGFDSLANIQSSAQWCFAIRSIRVPQYIS